MEISHLLFPLINNSRLKFDAFWIRISGFDRGRFLEFTMGFEVARAMIRLAR